MTVNTQLYAEAKSFIEVCYEELGKDNREVKSRLKEIDEEIKATGQYEHTVEELTHGAKMAWRNSNRCIGRLFWDKLHVRDERKLSTVEEIRDALFDHIQYATNGGKILPTITIFKPEANGKQQVRIWNHQLIRYAGYETDDGIVGDPHSIEFTSVCQKLGWKGAGSHFDVLPLVIQLNEDKPVYFDIPENIVLEVPISHPSIERFSELELKWYAVPMIADMKLEVGGIEYVAAPFNGWYMGTEIGARNLADTTRYDMLPKVAELLGLETKRDSTLWKDRALVELNVAVLESFKQAGVSIVDHHTAAQQHQLFEEHEKTEGRDITGKWSWLIPPVSPATTNVFHKNYRDEIVKPNYFYQKKAY